MSREEEHFHCVYYPGQHCPVQEWLQSRMGQENIMAKVQIPKGEVPQELLQLATAMSGQINFPAIILSSFCEPCPHKFRTITPRVTQNPTLPSSQFTP